MTTSTAVRRRLIRWRWLAVGVVAAVGLTACGSGSSGDSDAKDHVLALDCGADPGLLRPGQGVRGQGGRQGRDRQHPHRRLPGQAAPGRAGQLPARRGQRALAGHHLDQPAPGHRRDPNDPANKINKDTADRAGRQGPHHPLRPHRGRAVRQQEPVRQGQGQVPADPTRPGPGTSSWPPPRRSAPRRAPSTTWSMTNRPRASGPSSTTTEARASSSARTTSSPPPTTPPCRRCRSSSR